MPGGYLFIALATILFSTMEIALKLISADFHPMQLNFIRFTVGGLVLLPLALRIMHVKRQSGELKDEEKKGSLLASFMLLGLVGSVVSMTFYQLAVTHANASVVAVLFSCNPVFVLLFAAIILRNPILPRHVLALILECVGILFIINPLRTDISLYGIACSLLSTIFFALYAVLGTKQCMRYTGMVITCGSFLAAGLQLLLIIALSHLPPVAALLRSSGLELFADIPLFSGVTADNWPALLYVCVGVTGLGFASYFMAMQLTSPMQASLVFFLKPALAPILALIILKENIPFHMALGIGLILVGSLASLLSGERLRAILLHRQRM